MSVVHKQDARNVTRTIIQKGSLNVFVPDYRSVIDLSMSTLTLADAIMLMSKNFFSNKCISHSSVCRSKSSTISFAIANTCYWSNVIQFHWDKFEIGTGSRVDKSLGTQILNLIKF